MVHADQDGFFDSHVERKLEGEVGDRGTLPDAPAHVRSEARTGIGSVDKGG